MPRIKNFKCQECNIMKYQCARKRETNSVNKENLRKGENRNITGEVIINSLYK